MTPRLAAAASSAADTRAAAREIAKSLRSRLGLDRAAASKAQSASEIDFAIAFFTPAHAATLSELRKVLDAALSPRCVLAACAEGVFGPEREIEGGPAISVLAGSLPGAELRTLQLSPDDWREALSDRASLRQRLNLPRDPKLLILLADPYSTPTTPLLESLNDLWPALPVVGGLSSGPQGPGSNVLVADDLMAEKGVVGLAIGGEVEVDLIVSQACRPLGPVFEVTAAKRNVIMGLGGQLPMSRLQALLPSLPSAERDLAAQGLYLGRAVGQNGSPGRGDFLVRSVIGLDRESGLMFVGDTLSEGERVQFHVQDAEAAHEDLQLLLSPQTWQAPPAAVLAFAADCRGRNLYGRPDVDLGAIRGAVGDAAISGCFCVGEIGPIAGASHVHGQALSMVLIR